MSRACCSHGTHRGASPPCSDPVTLTPLGQTQWEGGCVPPVRVALSPGRRPKASTAPRHAAL